jgi:hypothetical protein
VPSALDVAVSGTIAAVASGSVTKLYVVDIADPTQPQIIGSNDEPEQVSFGGVGIFGSAVYLATTDEFWVISIANPTSPVAVDSVPVPAGGFALDLQLTGSTVYFAACSEFLVIDVNIAGACCVNGACVPLTETDCALVSGLFLGLDQSCQDAACPDPMPTCAPDITGDGVVNSADLNALLTAFGDECP